MAEAQQMEVIKESNKAKSQFLARMSHEIRTPITAVLGISEIELKNHERNQTLTPRLAESFGKIHSSATSLLGIVNDILDLSKIEADKLEILCNEYDVASMISDVAHTHLAYLKDKSIRFRVEVDEDIPAKLLGDVLRIKQVMNNLLSNAFKYTQKGSVTLSIAWAREGLFTTITDTGVGMEKGQLEALAMSNDYIRFHEEKMRHVEGTGLGMPIVYNLVHMMGGAIGLDSEIGRGTVVTVHLPQGLSSSTPKPLGIEAARRLERFEVSSLLPTNNKPSRLQKLMPHGKVLVVDDVESNLYVIRGMLEPYELQYETCSSGKEAIDKIKGGKVYDIIFMDQMMPEMDGTEAMNVIRQMGYTKPIVAFTANVLVDQLEELLRVGFDDFVSKPVDGGMLDRVLSKYIKDVD